MKTFALLILVSIFLSACGSAAADAQGTAMALAVQLTLLAQSTNTEVATSTETSTSASTTAADTATSPPLPTATDVPAEPTATPYVVPDWPLFRNGDVGPEVYAIQHLLRSHGYNLTVDGIFGPETRQQVIAFQNAKNLGADGIVGPQTWGALIQGRTIDQGDTGQAVRALQRLLRDKFGYNNVQVDADFGPITNNAVLDFQDEYDLTVDGIVGPETWQALVAIEP